MNQYRLSLKSIKRLRGVHPDLILIVTRAIQLTDHDFGVHEGVRTLDRQRELMQRGVSWTLRSKHLVGHAVDLYPAPLDWNDAAAFTAVASAMRQAARELDVAGLQWGFDLWGKDMPHFQLASATPINGSVR